MNAAKLEAQAGEVAECSRSSSGLPVRFDIQQLCHEKHERTGSEVTYVVTFCKPKTTSIFHFGANAATKNQITPHNYFVRRQFRQDG
jgi:hypothetical protein